uniref:Uncharacterized protein n=1 Tax=Timema poppense TaxID=170557 RepID=A0A7R9GWN5_TIMPO|nr:unnamed protein product [Timema poppensis]
MAGVSLNTIKYHEGFMGPRIGPVSCLQFHPHRVCLAAGSMDNSISIYSALTVALLTACHLKTRGEGVGRFGFKMSGADRRAPDCMPFEDKR